MKSADSIEICRFPMKYGDLREICNQIYIRFRPVTVPTRPKRSVLNTGFSVGTSRGANTTIRARHSSMLKFNIRSLSSHAHITFVLHVLSFKCYKVRYSMLIITPCKIYWFQHCTVSSSKTQLNCMKHSYVEQNATLIDF